MDLEPALRIAVRRVSQALHEYARERGWRPADYEIEIAVNVDWGRIYVTFVAKQFRGRDGMERFNEVQDYLETELKKYPEIIEAVDLVVKDPRQHREEAPFPLGPSDVLVPPEELRYIPHKRLKSR